MPNQPPNQPPSAIPLLPCLEWQATPECNASIIWLHGLGANGHDFAPIVHELQFKNLAQTRFIFPHAPTRPVTINNGLSMPAWYDIARMEDLHSSRGQPDMEGVRTSAAQVEALMAREMSRGIAAERLILAGFSQGGLVALHAGLSTSHRIAGIMALSTYLPHAAELTANPARPAAELPVFVAHGGEDPVVPYAMGQAIAQHLQQAGHPVSWHSYRMQHSVCPTEIRDISLWLADRLDR